MTQKTGLSWLVSTILIIDQKIGLISVKNLKSSWMVVKKNGILWKMKVLVLVVYRWAREDNNTQLVELSQDNLRKCMLDSPLNSK